MKGIKITSELQEKNEFLKNREVGTFYTGNIPNSFHGTRRISGGYKDRTDLHELDGWLEVENPQLTATQKRGNQKIKNGKITFEVVEKSTEELRNEVLSNAEMQKQELIRTLQEAKVIEEMQGVEDEEKLLKVSSIFPMWEEGLEVKTGQKYQHFKNGELVLFRVVQGHTTQADWKPESTPALFTRVGFANEVLDWVQPTGAHDAYQTGDKVKFQGKTYESLINANTWSPTAYPQGWKQV